jgi:hypothetical protein
MIRARAGVLTTAELLQHTGSKLPEAEQEMARLLGAYDGEAAVSPSGELVYAFPTVMATAHGTEGVRAPNPAWQRLEHPLELTGNTAGANLAVAGMNAFTLTAAATAPWFIFPRLGLGGPAAFVGLVLVPIVFSVLFFTGPLLRMLGVARENKHRSARNVRKVLLGLVYERALAGGPAITVPEAHDFVRSRLKDSDPSLGAVESALHDIAAELDAEVTTDDTGTLRFEFPEVRRQFQASEAVRSKLRLEKRSLGEIVYDTSDSPEEATRRDQALFDRQLAGESADLRRYLPSVDRVSFEDDYEVVAFDEELSRSRTLR